MKEYNGIVDNEQLKKEQKIIQVYELKEKLRATDYLATKHSEGWITEEEYAPMKAQRQEWRDEINQLEKEIK